MNNVPDVKMTEAESLAFIEDCMETCMPVIQALAPRQTMRAAVDLPIDRDKLNAAISNTTLIGFPEGMSRRYKTIIKRTQFFADLSAEIKYPKKDQQVLRWEHYVLGMRAMGWTKMNASYTGYESEYSGLSMSNIVLDIVQAAIGGAAGTTAAVLKAVANKTIEGLAKSPEALKLYEKNGQKAYGASMGVMTVAQDAGEDVWAALGTTSYFSDAGNKKIVFFDKMHAGAQVYQGKATFTIYEDDYTSKKEAAANAFFEAADQALELEFGIK
ncbi:hypothetical protein [Pseudomonas frederiksbergensis]|uniref:Uncharacterized protein n=1 Tax=Pseudomonas frederiksbergensis TaxID=104087 RepID=A0A423KRW6_9PSED|nr:hypothetical protein [Pseudomonas frederiksbergensis]RON58428.1 hypothetical protein BK665_00415 [Pseudomonas frederiksbergensis]